MGKRSEKFGVAIVMKKGVIFFLLCSFLFFLSGCLDFERASISIDMARKAAEVKFSNIVSNSTDEETIKEDLRDLIKKVYFDEDSKSDPDRITSRRLYRDDEKLCGIERFSFQSLPRVLKEFSIETDKNGDYILDVTKESENYQISGNGQPIQKGPKKLLKWRKNVKKIEIGQKSREFDETKETSLLMPWLDWADNATPK